jgi:putative flippase GtrA
VTLPLGQLLRFAAVGASNSAITLVTYALFVRAGAPPVAASAVGFALGAANGYRLNRRWTFRSDRHGAGAGARYVAVQLTALAINALGVALAVGATSVPRLAGEFVILPPVTVMTFLASRHWVFRPAAR